MFRPKAYMMLDVTYYLRETIENMEFRGEHTVHYASARFHSVHGEYQLPWECGTVIVENRVQTTRLGFGAARPLA
jgi:hypothetical protein